MTKKEPPLTDQEIKLLQSLGDCFTDYCCVAEHGPTREQDLREFAAHIHDLQRAVMAQAAARIYPELFRLAGGGFQEEP